MRKAVVLFALLSAVATFADTRERIAQAVALHDAGKYDEAIAIYKAILAEEPDNNEVAYELSLTYEAKGDFAKCRALLEPRVKRDGPYRAALYTGLGNCLDMDGKPAEAIAAFREGLKIDPSDPQLLYNLAVTLASQKQSDEARELLKKELQLNPNHPSGRYTLAGIFMDQNFRAPAVLEYVRFLTLEPAGERSKVAATNVVKILNIRVKRKSEKETIITIDPNAPATEGDMKVWDVAMAIAGAASSLPEKQKLSEFERMQSQLATTLKIFAETPDKGSSYTATHNLPFLAAMYDKKIIDALAAVALMPLNLSGQNVWLQKNQAVMEAYLTFMAEQQK